MKISNNYGDVNFISDFENAAFVSFIQLLIRIINLMELDFYLPITKVDENMETVKYSDF
jgi:glutamate--cysteine ligase catalytic subunit